MIKARIRFVFEYQDFDFEKNPTHCSSGFLKPKPYLCEFEVLPRIGETVYLVGDDQFYSVVNIVHTSLHKEGTPIPHSSSREPIDWSVELILK